MRVRWTDTAISHLRSLHAYIGRSSPEQALRIIDRLARRSQQIAVFPQSGRIVSAIDLPQIREVLEGPSGHSRCHSWVTTNTVDHISGPLTELHWPLPEAKR